MEPEDNARDRDRAPLGGANVLPPTSEQEIDSNSVLASVRTESGFWEEEGDDLNPEPETTAATISWANGRPLGPAPADSLMLSA